MEGMAQTTGGHRRRGGEGDKHLTHTEGVARHGVLPRPLLHMSAARLLTESATRKDIHCHAAIAPRKPKPTPLRPALPHPTPPPTSDVPMMTPPLSICARPALTRKVPTAVEEAAAEEAAPLVLPLPLACPFMMTGSGELGMLRAAVGWGRGGCGVRVVREWVQVEQVEDDAHTHPNEHGRRPTARALVGEQPCRCSIIRVVMTGEYGGKRPGKHALCQPSQALSDALALCCCSCSSSCKQSSCSSAAPGTRRAVS